MSDTELARLTLVFPPVLEARIVELMLEQEPPLPGFTVLAAEGHGADFARASTREQVRGRVARRLLTLVLPRARAEARVAQLRIDLATTESAWWLEPVLAFGRFA